MEELIYEKALDELKSIVQALEKGDRPLEESLRLFEKGIALVTLCSRKLDEVDKKVELLVGGPDAGVQTIPFPDNAGG